MKILFVSESYYPYQSGVPMVVKYLAEGLAVDNEVTVATSISPTEELPVGDEYNGVHIRRFLLWHNIAKRVKGDLLGIRSFVLNGAFDVVIIECGQAMTTDALLPIMSQMKVPCILHAHGLSGLLCKPFGLKSDFKHTIGGTYNWLRMQIYYGYTFKRQCKYFAASISLTDCDSGFDYVTKNIQSNYVLCNAADDAFFEKAEEQYELPTDGRPYLISICLLYTSDAADDPRTV